MPTQGLLFLDQPETISLVGRPTPLATLPAGYVRWRFRLSAVPSARWKLNFQDPAGGSGRIQPRLVSFDRDALILECDQASVANWESFIQRWLARANQAMQSAPPEALRLVVEYLPSCAGWFWELHCGAEIVESSWRDDWIAYPSRAEAARAGAERLKAARQTWRRCAAQHVA